MLLAHETKKAVIPTFISTVRMFIAVYHRITHLWRDVNPGRLFFGTKLEGGLFYGGGGFSWVEIVSRDSCPGVLLYMFRPAEGAVKRVCCYNVIIF